MMYFILLLGLMLRLVNINQSLWLDEAFQYKASALFSLKEMLTVYLPGDFNPPLSYLINYFAGQIFGYSELALRLPSVIFGVLTVWFLFKLAGKWPALLLATSGLHVYYSQEARMYSLAALAVTASFYFLQKKQWSGYALASLMAIYSHYLTWFIFPAQILLVKKTELNKLFLSWVVMVLGFLPWLPIFMQQLQAGAGTTGTAWGNIVGGLSLKSLALIPVKFLIGRISLDNNWQFAAVMIWPLIMSAWIIWRSKREKMPMIWLLVPLGLIVVVSYFIPVLAYFRLLFLLPAFYWLLAAKTPKSLFAVLLIFNLVTAGIYLFVPKFHREDWRSLTRRLDDRPVVAIAAVDAPLKYYFAGDIRTTELIPQENFYYAAYAEAIFDPELNFRRRAADAGFSQVKEEHYRGNLTLIEYNQ